MKKVTKIDSRAVNPIGENEAPKLRVAAYCRVSTDSDEQKESLETQIRHYESYIKANPAWTFAGVYSDEGVTGTKKEKRPELLRMIADCEDGRIDYIVTKSISRFARNTADCLELVRKLQKRGIFIYFEKENLDTGTMESEFMLSILSGLATEESASISQNNKWSIQRRFQNGTYKITCPPYGYDSVDGMLVINERQAKVVRFIFSEILSGKGTPQIAKELNRRGQKGKMGGQWTSTSIRGMVINEKYVGDVVFQKTYTDSNFNHRRNDGEKEKYLISNHHEPIVSREDFEAVQAVIAQHRREKGIKPKQTKYLNRYPFSGKIICGHCGGTFKRRTHAYGRHKIAWCCGTHIADIAKCPVKYIPESVLECAFVTMMNKLIFANQTVLKPLLFSLRGVNADDGMERIGELEKSLEENRRQQEMLVSLMSKGYLEPAVYKKSNNELLREAERIQHQKDSVSRLLSCDSQYLTEVSELLQYCTKAKMLRGFDGELFSRFVERIHVYEREKIGFEMKCGITLKERLVI